jgi:hypothetical protein
LSEVGSDFMRTHHLEKQVVNQFLIAPQQTLESLCVAAQGQIDQILIFWLLVENNSTARH